MRGPRFTLDTPPFAGRTGRGVVVVVVDSGINSGHPHVGHVADGARLDGSGPAGDWADRLGHGTAVAAAIREKAPGAELVAAKVFDRALATSAEVLAHAITWASAQGARLVNLSLGTANAAHEAVLRHAVDQAALKGTIVVSARESNGVRWMPGGLPGAVGVIESTECEREELEVLDVAGFPLTLRASAYPRPIPGLARERNLSGVSFAVANATGFLARLLEGAPSVRSIEAVAGLLVPRPEHAHPGDAA